MNNQNDHDLYTIPPNFIGSSTFLGGLFKVRNVIEAGILAVVIGVPVIFLLPFGVTAKVIILCLTALPAALFALMGIGGESLSSFLIVFVKYLKNRRVVTDERVLNTYVMVDSDEPITMDAFIRTALLDTPYYFGSVFECRFG